MVRKWVCGLAATMLLLGALEQARADVVIYDNSDDFYANTDPDNYYLNDFANDDGPEPSPLYFSGNGFNYTATTGHDGFYSIPHRFTPNYAFDPITFTFTDGNVTAVGGNFWVTDVNWNTIPGDIRVDLADGTGVLLSQSDPTQFVGFTSDVPIDSLTLTPQPQTAFAWATVNNLFTGFAIPQ